MFALANPIFAGLYLLAILLAHRHGSSSASIGLMLAIIGVGGMLGALGASTIRRTMTPRAIIRVEQCVLLVLVLGLLLVHTALLIGLLIAGAELLTPAVNSVVAAARVASTPDRLQGRVQAASTMSGMSLAWLGPLAVGISFEHAGATTTILLLAAWSALPAMIALLTPALRSDPPAPLPARTRQP